MKNYRLSVSALRLLELPLHMHVNKCSGDAEKGVVFFAALVYMLVTKKVSVSG